MLKNHPLKNMELDELVIRPSTLLFSTHKIANNYYYVKVPLKIISSSQA